MTAAWLTDSVTSDLDRALHYTTLWGLEGIELHTMGSSGQVVPYVDEEKLTRRLMEYDMPLVAVVPGLFEGPVSDRVVWLNELTTLPETLGFCRRVGCDTVVVSSFAAEGVVDEDACAEVLRRAGETAASEEVTLAVINQSGGAHTDGQALADLLEVTGHPNVRAAWDPAAAVKVGANPAEGVEALGEYVALVRCADGLLRGGEWMPRPLGDGEVGWLDQLRRLHVYGFDGPLSLIVDVEPRQKYGLRAGTRLIQMMRQAA